jgi:outer membrane protein assembly factor BamB
MEWRNLARNLLLALALLDLCMGSSRAGDWPQILGSHRDGRTDDEKIVEALPAAGLRPVWQRGIGEGYAGVAVSGGRVVLFHRVEGDEVVEGLDAATGKPLWSAKFATPAPSSMDSDKGPRCVPVISGERVFLFGAGGNLYAVSLKKGEKLWSRDLTTDFNIPDSYFGCGSSPMVVGDKVLLNVGGRGARHGIAAFSVKDGSTVWQSVNDAASYSSPIVATHDGVKHAIFVTRLNVVSLDPETGRERFRYPFGRRGPTVNAACPLVVDGHLFLSASYGVGALFGKFTKDSFTEIWANDDTMSSQYSTCVLHDGLLYGVDGREDVGVARLRCIEPRTGKVRWTEEGFGVAAPILADGKLLLQKTDGTLVLAEPSPKSFRSLGSAKLMNDTTRALPALSQGRYFLRDSRTLKCFDLSRK